MTKPVVGRAVTRLTGNTITVRGARIDATSPLVSESTRAQLALRLYESAELRFVDRYLRSDLDVVELGSSIGVIGSVVLTKLSPGRRLAAVEADADLAEVARVNFGRNAGANPWTLDVAAISYGSTDGLAFAKGTTSTAGRLIRNRCDDGDLPELLTLSQLLDRRGIDRYVLVSDIEGAEEGLIGDDESALSRCEQLIIELHSTDTMRVDEMRAALIERHGYSVTAEHGPVMVLDRR